MRMPEVDQLLFLNEEDRDDAARTLDEVRHLQLAGRQQAERDIQIVEEADWLDELGVPVVTVQQLHQWTMEAQDTQ